VIIIQKWEYLFVSFTSGEHGWKPSYINGEEIEYGSDLPSIYDFSNLRGEEGWELVSYEPIVESKSLNLNFETKYINILQSIRTVFKRPKE